MRKFFSNLIAAGFILLMVLVLISGLSVLLGFEKPENIEGGDPHDKTGYAYGNWAAMLLSVGIFSFFVISFLTPLKKQNWRTLGIYEAFIIALFSEMYGFPLTIYVLSSLFGLIVLTIGLLIQWPTIITLAMWPVLVLMYYRLAKREEMEALEAFGGIYEEYMRQTPMFLPSLRRRNIVSQVIS